MFVFFFFLFLERSGWGREEYWERWGERGRRGLGALRLLYCMSEHP